MQRHEAWGKRDKAEVIACSRRTHRCYLGQRSVNHAGSLVPTARPFGAVCFVNSARRGTKVLRSHRLMVLRVPRLEERRADRAERAANRANDRLAKERERRSAAEAEVA